LHNQHRFSQNIQNSKLPKLFIKRLNALGQKLAYSFISAAQEIEDHQYCWHFADFPDNLGHILCIQQRPSGIQPDRSLKFIKHELPAAQLLLRQTRLSQQLQEGLEVLLLFRHFGGDDPFLPISGCSPLLEVILNHSFEIRYLGIS